MPIKNEKNVDKNLEDSERVDEVNNLELETSEADYEEALNFFNTETLLDDERRNKIQKTIGEIKDVSARVTLTKLYSEMLGKEMLILEERHEAILEIADAVDIPPFLLEETLQVAKTDGEVAFNSAAVQEAREHNSELEKFAGEAKKFSNLLYIDINLSAGELHDRWTILDSLYNTFKKINFADRNKMEKVLNDVFEIPTITKNLQTYLDETEKKAREKLDGLQFSEGAENKNLIFQGHELGNKVLKISKERHDSDFTSILKLMRDMHAITLHFNQSGPVENNMEAKASFNDMIIYKNQEGSYKRLIRQNFESGISIKKIPEEIKNSPEYIAAWQAFLRQTDNMKHKYGVVLDISDSSKKSYKRGNISNTENVFVKLPTQPNEKYEFSVIDLDVFDDRPGQHKFDPLEQVRKNGLAGVMPALSVGVKNQMRENYVYLAQKIYMSSEQKKNL